MKWFLALICLLSFAAAQTVVELRHADFNSNRIVDGSISSLLKGHVEFQYGNVNITADSTIWNRGSGILRIGGGVRVHRPKQLITCDSLIFFSDQKKFILRGRATMVDSSREVTLKSREADYFLDKDSLEMRYKPKVFFWDSKSKDTVVVTGEPMHYLGETGTARVLRNITISGPDLNAKAQRGWYSTEKSVSQLIGRARVDYGLSTITGNLIHVYMTDQTVDSFSVVGDSPTGITKDTTTRKDGTRDTTINRLTGDSLRFVVDSSRIKKITSLSSAKMERFAPANEGKADIVWARTITTDIEKNGDGTASCIGQVRALYRSDKDATNEIAGDDLFIVYDRNGAAEITLSGGVQGVILPKEDDE